MSDVKNISYLKILDDMPNPIWRSGVDLKCDFFNKGWLKFTGRTMAEEMGDGWVKGVHPDDLKRCVDIYVSSFNKHQPFQMEYRVKFNDGSYHWILDCGAPFYDETGEFQGYIGSCYDINDAKLSSETIMKANEELEKFNKLAVDRELKMIELKEEINALKQKVTL